MGFSDILGDVDLDSNYNRLSSETKQQIEHEVRRIVDESRQRARKILTEKRKELDILAKALVEYEVLNLEEMQKVLKGEKLQKMTSTPKVAIKLPELALPPGAGVSSRTAILAASDVDSGNGARDGGSEAQ